MTAESRLTRYPSGSFREFLSIVVPLIFSSLSVMMLELCDSIFIARYATSAWETVTAAQLVFYFFQWPISLIIMMSHPFISNYLGAKQLEKIGPLVWQMVYFAIGSTLFIWLLYPLGQQYLHHTEIQRSGVEYLNLMVTYFFLFPLGTALSMFHLGCCKQKTILKTTVVTQLINVVLDYALIFGVKGIVPSFGVRGAAMATLIAQSTFCLILLISFLRSSNAKYLTHKYQLDLSLWWPVMKKGILRSTFAAVSLGGALIGAKFLINRGGDYLLVFSFGNTLLNIMYCFLDGYGPGIVTIASNIVGSKQLHLYRNLTRNTVIFGTLFVGICSLIMIVGQNFIISTYIKDALSPETLTLLKQTLWFMVLVCIASTFSKTIDSVLVALKKIETYAVTCVVYAFLIIVLPSILFPIFNAPASSYFGAMALTKAISGAIVLTAIRRYLRTIMAAA